MKLKSQNNYNIMCDEYITGKEDIVIIAMHGFAGDRKSTCIKKLRQSMLKLNIGLITFDWPSHGESEVDGKYLTVNNCLIDLETVYNYVKQKNTKSKIIAFSTSFGGYITLLYNIKKENKFDGIILRAPAIQMYDVLMNNILNNDMMDSLKTNRYFDFGFERIMRVESKFIEELKNNNIFDLYKNNVFNNIDIIHGTNDITVPIIDSVNFCKDNNFELYKIEGANHRFDIQGQVEEVVKISKKIIIQKYINKNKDRIQ